MDLQHAQILIVDDIPENLKLLINILTSQGYKVRPAASGQIALRSVAVEEPDLILLDIRMPGMDGYEVCRQLKENERHREIPVIFISAMDEAANKMKGFEAGAIDYITKPFEPAEVLARVKTHLRLRQLQIKMEAMIQQRTEELAKEKARFQSIVRSSPTGIATLVDEKFLDVNKRLCDILGYTEGELVGSSARMLYQSEDEFEKDRRATDNLGTTGMASSENHFRCKDGRVIDVLLNWSCINPIADMPQVRSSSTTEGWQQGKVAETLNNVADPAQEKPLRKELNLTLLDITERKQMEQALRDSEIHYRTIFDNTGTAMLITDENMVISLVNAESVALLGISKEELEGKRKWTDFVTPESLKKMQEYLPIRRTEQQNGAPKEYEAQLLDAEGNLVDVLIAVAMIPGTKKSVASLIDVTDQKKLEAYLRHNQKIEAIGVLAGGIAHDFNNILSAILGYTEMALGKSIPEGVVHRYLEQTFQAGMRAKELVHQILTFSRQTEQEMQPVPVSLIAKEALKLLRSTLPATIEIRKDMSSSFQKDVILGDSTQIHQVFMNLCTNAAHAMQAKGGILSVKVAEIDVNENLTRELPDLAPGPYVLLSVGDTGHGMDKVVMEKIFQPYFTTKPQGVGSGLGLSVVMGIIKKFNGTITVSSEPGKGSVFNVYLPRYLQAIMEPAEIEVKEEIPEGNERILLVDDESILADMGKEILEDLGYQVTVTTSSLEALAMFSNTPNGFDLIFTDMTMPNMTGIELCSKCREIRPDMLVILGSGHSDLIDENSMLNAGIAKFIVKPYPIDQLANTLRQVLDGRNSALA